MKTRFELDEGDIKDAISRYLGGALARTHIKVHAVPQYDDRGGGGVTGYAIMATVEVPEGVSVGVIAEPGDRS